MKVGDITIKTEGQNGNMKQFELQIENKKCQRKITIFETSETVKCGAVQKCVNIVDLNKECRIST